MVLEVGLTMRDIGVYNAKQWSDPEQISKKLNRYELLPETREHEEEMASNRK